MPTLNCEKTIRMSLESARKQNFNQNLIEILIIDGGSSDKTLEIAEKFNCIVLKNEKKLPEFAKHIGILKASGKYAVFLDSDEVFNSADALNNRLEIFKKTDAKIIFTGGYIKPIGAHFINDYINYFSDPFSFFMYGISSDSRYYMKSILKKYKNHSVSEKYIAIFLDENSALPLSDLCAGNSIDINYAKIIVNKKINEPSIISQIISLILREDKRLFILKNDFIIHNSSDSLKKYINKIKWRIKDNMFYANETAGFSNRESYNNLLFKFKKYLFIPYSLTLALPLFYSLYLAIKRKNVICLLHPILTFYTGFLIGYYYFLKILGIKPGLTIYGK